MTSEPRRGVAVEIRLASPRDTEALASLRRHVHDLHVAARPDHFRPLTTGREEKWRPCSHEAVLRVSGIHDGAGAHVADDLSAQVRRRARGSDEGAPASQHTRRRPCLASEGSGGKSRRRRRG